MMALFRSIIPILLIISFVSLGCHRSDLVTKNKETTHYIKTRLVLERNRVFPDHEIYFVVDPERVRRDIEQVEKVYEPINLKIYITEIVYVDQADTALFTDYLDKDAINHPDVLNIYYLLTRPEFAQWSGLAPFPTYDPPNNYIFLYTYAYGHNTLAHEIGHYFFLYHVFDTYGDFVKDTPKTNVHGYTTNIMDYSSVANPTITKGQLNRVLNSIRKYRQNQIITLPNPSK